MFSKPASKIVTKSLLASCLALAFLVSGPARAGQVASTIEVEMTLLSSCSINGSPGQPRGPLGTLDFGRQPTDFRQQDAQVLHAGHSIQILCSEGVSPLFTVVGGVNDNNAKEGADHAMLGNGHYIPYNLFMDAGYSKKLSRGSSHSLEVSDGVTSQSLNLYGRAYQDLALPPGRYVDTLRVSLDF